MLFNYFPDMVSDSSGSDQKYRFKPDIKVFNCIFCSKDRETNILFDGLQISGNVQLLNFQVWRLEQCERKERITQIWNKNWEFSWSTYMYVIWGTGSDPSAEFRSGSVSDHWIFLIQDKHVRYLLYMVQIILFKF